MSEFELIFFAGVAVFFAYRLWTVLGRTNGDEKSRAEMRATIVEVQPKPAAKPTLLKKAEAKPAVVVEEIVPKKFAADIAAIKAIDASFSLKQFFAGASAAFDAVIDAYSAANRKRLKFLLSDEVFAHFDAELTENEAQARKASITLVSVEEPEIVDISLENKIAHITLKFKSEQINFATDADGKLVEGSKTHIENVKDSWVFERDLTSRKPQWLVVGTDGE